MLELKTIFVYSAAINLAVALVATVALVRNPKQKDVFFWCFSAWMIVFGGLFMSAPTLLPFHLMEYIGGLLYVGSTGMLRLGFLEFFDSKYRLSEAFSVALIICVGLVLVNFDPQEASGRIAMLYAGSGINLAMTASALWDGKHGELLPARSYAGHTFLAYALVNLLIIPMAFLQPVVFQDGMPISAWLGPTSILLVLFNMAAFLLAVVVKLERSGEIQRVLAERDALTGVLNRRMFLERAETLILRGGALAMIDLDHFKRINDTYGHIGGDEALVQFAALALRKLPREALFGRVGGEEFGVCLPGHDLGAAHAMLENLRRDLEATEIRSNGQAFTLTMSCGYVIMGDPQKTLDSWMVDADCALYAVKNTGRNRVMAFDPVGLLRGHVEFSHIARSGNDEPMQTQLKTA